MDTCNRKPTYHQLYTLQIHKSTDLPHSFNYYMSELFAWSSRLPIRSSYKQFMSDVIWLTERKQQDKTIYNMKSLKNQYMSVTDFASVFYISIELHGSLFLERFRWLFRNNIWNINDTIKDLLDACFDYVSSNKKYHWLKSCFVMQQKNHNYRFG